MFKRVIPQNISSSKTKHTKLSEGWSENRDPVGDGVTFYLEHLGSTLVDELPEGESYSGSLSAKAIEAVVTMMRASGKKPRKVSVTVSCRGIHVVDVPTNETLINITITRIAFCTADRRNEKIFAFMARNDINETVECHCFLCPKHKIAEAVTLTVSQAFNLAKELELSQQQQHSFNERLSSTDVLEVSSTGSTGSSGYSQDLQPIIHFPAELCESFGLLPMDLNQNGHSPTWETFGDDESPNDIAEDEFSSLALRRGRSCVDDPLPAGYQS